MGTDEPIIWACLIVSTLALVNIFRTGGTRNALFLVAAFFAFFAFGPVINYLRDDEYYFGTIVEFIPKACIGFTLAVVTLAVVNRLVPQRNEWDFDRLAEDTRHGYEFLPIALFATIAYGAGMTAINGLALLSATKQTALAAAGPYHRVYLFLGIVFAAYYFITRRTSLLRTLYAAHLVTFVAYSLVFRERDFLFVVIAVVVHREILRAKSRSFRVVLTGAVAAVAGTLLFALRQGSGFNATGLLNQGLLLFVDTFLMRRVPSTAPYEMGGTYLEAVKSLPPAVVYDTGEPTLSQWLVQLYNPQGTVGYGFSLTGEAYLNFGLAGIPVVFAVCALVHRFFVNRLDRSDWYGWASIYFTATWMYALRGDSLQLMKTVLFGAVVFAVFRILSSRSHRWQDVHASSR